MITPSPKKRPLLLEAGFLGSLATVLPVVWFSAIGCIFWTKVVMAFCFALLTLTGIVWVSFARPAWYLSRRDRVYYRFRRIGLVGLCAGILVSIPETHWPLLLGFSLAQPALDDIADRLERGEKVALPARAGFFLVTDAKMGRISGSAAPPLFPMLFLEDYGPGATTGFLRGEVDSYCSPNPRHGIVCTTAINPRWEQFEAD